jgi:hypothetical protein
MGVTSPKSDVISLFCVFSVTILEGSSLLDGCGDFPLEAGSVLVGVP